MPTAPSRPHPRASNRALRALLPLALLAFAGCDDENVSWVFVSNPGGPNGGAVIVIRYTSLQSASETTQAVRLSGTDSRGAVTLSLLTQSDTAVLERTGEVELRTPLLGSARRLPGAIAQWPATGPTALRLDVTDASVLDGQALGRGRLHVSAAGNLLVLEHQAGLNVYAAGSAPERLPPVYSLEPTPTELRIAQPNGGYRTLTAPPAPRPEQRLATNTGRGSVRLLGPGGEGLAELPQDRVTLHGGSGGLFLSAAFPSGLGGDDRTPMTLYMAEHNRYLARVEAAR